MNAWYCFALPTLCNWFFQKCTVRVYCITSLAGVWRIAQKRLPFVSKIMVQTLRRSRIKVDAARKRYNYRDLARLWHIKSEDDNVSLVSHANRFFAALRSLEPIGRIHWTANKYTGTGCAWSVNEIEINLLCIHRLLFVNWTEDESN